MKVSRMLWTGCGAVALAAGCADSTAPNSLEPGAPVLYSEPTAEDLEDMPPEFKQASIITAFEVTAGFTWEGLALATAILDYYATNARVTATVRLLHGGTQVGTPVSATQARSDYLPWFRTLSAVASTPVPGPCGHTAAAQGQGEVRMEFPIRTGNLFRWGELVASGANYADQPACADDGCPPGGTSGENDLAAISVVPTSSALQCSAGSGGSGTVTSGGNWVAVTTTTCYGTHYYDSTGRYLHTEIHYCTSITSYHFEPA